MDSFQFQQEYSKWKILELVCKSSQRSLVFTMQSPEFICSYLIAINLVRMFLVSSYVDMYNESHCNSYVSHIKCGILVTIYFRDKAGAISTGCLFSQNFSLYPRGGEKKRRYLAVLRREKEVQCKRVFH